MQDDALSARKKREHGPLVNNCIHEKTYCLKGHSAGKVGPWPAAGYMRTCTGRDRERAPGGGSHLENESIHEISHCLEGLYSPLIVGYTGACRELRAHVATAAIPGVVDDVVTSSQGLHCPGSNPVHTSRPYAPGASRWAIEPLE